MRVARLFTQEDKDPLKGAPSRAHQDDEWQEYQVPRNWGRSAADVLAAKVFCRGAVPALLKPVPEEGVPPWLWRRGADDAGLDGVSAEWRYRQENGFAEAFDRIAGGLAWHAWKAGVFDGEEDARAFYDEFRHLLLHQIAAPEMALLSAAGLDWAYGMDALFVPAARIAGFSDALFAQNVAGAGIAVARDAPPKHTLKRLALLAEKQALEEGACGIAVTLPVENIESPAFAGTGRRAGISAVAKSLGEKTLEAALCRVMDACDRGSVFGFDPARNGRLMQAMIEARRAGVPESALRMAVQYAQQGFEDLALFPRGEEEDAGPPLAAALSVPDSFVESALTGHGFLMTGAGGEKRHYPAEKLWDSVAAAIWSSGDPAVFFRDSAACGFLGDGADIAPSGSGGLVFLPDAAAPAATISLAQLGKPGHVVDAEKLGHAVRIMVIALEASFSFAAAPAGARAYRPLALGVAGLSAALMENALSYDSEEGRATAALIAALVTGAAHEASAEIAASCGAFPAYAAAEKEFLQGMKDKMAAFSGTAYIRKGVARRPAELKPGLCPDIELVEAAKASFARAYALGKDKGFRHAHLTALDTSAALQTLLGAQTRDIAPAAALVRFEGYFADGAETAGLYGKKLNPAAMRALSKMGFSAQAIDDISFYAAGHGTLLDAPAINHAALRARGFHQAALDALEAALGTAQHIRYAFNKWTLGEDFCTRMLGFSAEELAGGAFDMLAALGFSGDDIDAANLYCCGAMTLEGAPHIRPAQLAVFDCLAPAGAGVRRVSAEAQVRMQAAVESFLSGACCHTVGLGHYAAVDEVQKLLLLGWELGVKRISLYRDGCSLAHPFALPEEAQAEEGREETQQRTLAAVS